MALCYYKETFTLGFVSAFFIFAMATFFEDVIGKFFIKVKSLLS